MTTAIKKPKTGSKAQQDNKRKPTAQELHQQTKKSPPAVNPTNTANNNPDTPLNSGAGYSAPDAPGESDESGRVTNTLSPSYAGGGDEEIPQPSPPPQTPVEDNPKM